MSGWDDLFGTIEAFGRLVDRIIGWLIVLVVLGGLIVAGTIAWRLAA